VHEAAIPLVEVEPAPQLPAFDFTPPSPTTPVPEASWFERSGQRYLLWGACVLAAALLIQAGLWVIEERKDTRTLALVANELKAEPQAPSPLSRTTPIAPPLVLLEPDPATVTPPTPEPAAEQAPAAVSAKPVRRTAPAPEQDATAATLKACREHGYHPAQCVKRGCSVTKYGFVCRGK
jgi:pyruvate/2-oxoglutarate dehydrogenase complex dihydrolipoamide acyltransferase (E2) component